MDTKTYYKVASSLFLIVGLAHLVRALYGWEAIVAGVIVPVWFSWVAAVVVLYLSYRGFTSKAVHKKK
ncbi:hypothetical protein COU15_02650 [Candidatus Kaiserbacteria bacterium CG10_big_fil_rev_8_21_14_0_10_45_20]|uniref:DUF3311 domain-containing protein n=1 Tax=Candidatus Kaiserbacteria bacterium CG10_big_fil_rev_8_21_14_0_10_45_20 TaxID=1974607 RepID=A0A2H0UF65_9BACT|nr:MAG: hypothetical protein COU15_02650 [Candidatus Kaiserbacteria bacterium CG10_big_fil_rev_8_21_14_0_10_45_20]